MIEKVKERKEGKRDKSRPRIQHFSLAFHTVATQSANANAHTLTLTRTYEEKENRARQKERREYLIFTQTKTEYRFDSFTLQ